MRGRKTRAHSGSSALAVSLALVGCRSTPTPIPLPLHVALLPVEVRENPAPENASESAGLRLALTSDTIAEGLARGLAGRGFQRVTRLQPLETEAVAQAAREQERLWQEEAASHGADVLVRTKVVYDPVVTGQINEKFWLNLPLFLLGGPLCYFIDDRSYEGRARLQAEFFDLTDVHEVLGEDARLLEFPILGEFSGTDLDFLDRAGKRVPSYALSLLVPAGLVARSNETVEARMNEEAVDALVADLLRRVQQERLEFLSNDLASFHIVEADSVAEWAGNGSVRFEVSMRVVGGVGLRDFVLSANGTEILRGALDGSPDADGRVWIREGRLQVAPETEYLRLRVVDAVGGRRSYTFKVKESEK